MALPLIATVAAKLGIEIGKYIIKKAGKKVLKKGAADKLRKQVAAKEAKQANRRTSKAPTKAQIEATKARNKSKETISRCKNARNVAKGHVKNVDTSDRRLNAALFKQVGGKQTRIDKFLNKQKSDRVEATRSKKTTRTQIK